MSCKKIRKITLLQGTILPFYTKAIEGRFYIAVNTQKFKRLEFLLDQLSSSEIFYKTDGFSMESTHSPTLCQHFDENCSYKCINIKQTYFDKYVNLPFVNIIGQSFLVRTVNIYYDDLIIVYNSHVIPEAPKKYIQRRPF